MSYYRRSGGDYAYDDYHDGGRGGGSQRWDRDRFERMRTRGPPPGGDSFRYEEDDRYYSGGGEDRRIRVDVDEGRRGGYSDRSGGYSDRSYYEDDRYYSSSGRTRPEYLEEDRYRSGGRDLAPYRRDYDRGYDAPPRSRSSVDGYERRSAPRYTDEERDINVNLHVTPPRQPRQSYREYDYSDSPRVKESYAEEEYRDVNVRRERERSTYRRYEDHDHRYEEPASSPQTHYHNKRGRTRMPKRLVHRNAILQMGYAFDEMEDFYVVRSALNKDQIDEVIKISESYFRESESYSKSSSTKVDESRMIAAPEPEKEREAEQEGGTEEVIETTTTKVIENPTKEDIERYTQATQGDQSSHDNKAKSHYSHHSHHSHHEENGGEEESSSSSSDDEQTQTKAASKAPSKVTSRGRRQSKSSHNYKEADYSYNEESYNNNNNRSTTVVLPERRKERDIKEEIRSLEAERRNLKKKADRDRESGDYEIWQTKERESSNEDKERDVIRVEKDSRDDRAKFVATKSNDRDHDRARSRSRRRPNKGMVNAALFSLT